MPQPLKRSPADRHLWQIRWVRDLLWGGLILVVLAFGYYLRGIFFPVFIGLVFAYLFSPFITYIEEKWHWPRPLVTLLLLSLLFIIFGGSLVILGPTIIEQAATFTQKFPEYVNLLIDRYGLKQATLMNELRHFAEHVRENPVQVFRSVFSGTSQAFDFMGSLIGTLTYGLVSAALIPIYSFFFSWHWLSILDSIQQHLPIRYKADILDLVTKMDEAIGSFFRGRLMIALLIGTLFSVGWFLADVPYWFLLGGVTGFLSLIPYAATLGWPLAVFMKYLEVATLQNFESMDWMAVAFWPSMVYVLVQILEGWVLTPWIQSQSTDLNAVTILLVVFIGGSLAGVVGLLLAIPLTVCLKILAKEMVVPFLKKWAKET